MYGHDGVSVHVDVVMRMVMVCGHTKITNVVMLMVMVCGHTNVANVVMCMGMVMCDVWSCCCDDVNGYGDVSGLW